MVFTPSSPVPSPPLRGRDAQLAALARPVHELALGRGAAAWITGPPGAGRSRLLAAACDLGRRAGARVHHAAADPAGATMPLAPLLDALLGGGEPVLDPRDVRRIAALPGWRSALLEELEHRLRDASSRVPLLVALDDVQWADPDTQLALGTLPRKLGGHPILWLAAGRSSGAPHPGAAVLELGPLDEHAVAQLARDVLGGRPDPSVLDLLAGAGGEPALLVELLLGLHDEGLVRLAGEAAVLAAPLVPMRVRDGLGRQVGRLPPAAREVVQVGSLLGHRFTAGHLAAMLDRSEATLTAAIRDAVASGLVAEHDGRLRFRHRLVRQVVSDGLPASLRDGLRRQAASVLGLVGARA